MDNVPVSGRLVVLKRHGGVASGYHCSPCECPPYYVDLYIDPGSATLVVGNSRQFRAYALDQDCNGGLWACDVTWGDAAGITYWSSFNPSVATASGNTVTPWGGGQVTFEATYHDWDWYWEVHTGVCWPAVQDDHSADVKVYALEAEVANADVVSDTIDVTLTPGVVNGHLTVTLVGNGGNVTLFNGYKQGGTHTFSFNRSTLPVRQYTQVKAEWTDNGKTATGTKAVSFYVLGTYTHTQYNTPAESQCSGSPATAYLTTGPTSCPWSTVSLVSQFISQAWRNGSGDANNNNYGLIQVWLAGCPPPPGGNENYFRRVSQVTPACGGQGLSNTTVAADLDSEAHPLSCGDSVLIVGLGSGGQTLKTVTDSCPACEGKAKLDNYNTSSACSLSSLGSYTTIRTNR